MTKVLFLTHENINDTAVARAMFYDIFKELNDNKNFFFLSANSNLNIKNPSKDNLFYERKRKKGISFIDFIKFLVWPLQNLGRFYSFNIYVCRSYPAAILVWAYTIFSKEKKFIFDTRGLFFDELYDSGTLNSKLILKILHKLERCLLHKSYRVLTVSQAQKDYYIQKYNISSCKVTTIHNGAPRSAISECKIQDDEINILYLGSFIKWHCTNELYILFKELSAFKKVQLTIYTKDISSANKIFDKLENVEIKQLNFRSNPKRFDLGFCLIDGGISKEVCFPVKFCEYINSGTKVLISNNIKDLSNLELDSNKDFLMINSKDIKNQIHQISQFIKDNKNYYPVLPDNLTFEFQVSKYKDVITNAINSYR